jgi:hypothetical protein
MSFHVFRCKNDSDIFIVTDDGHVGEVGNHLCPSPDDELEKAGVFARDGQGRESGFRRGDCEEFHRKPGLLPFRGKTFDPVGSGHWHSKNARASSRWGCRGPNSCLVGDLSFKSSRTAALASSVRPIWPGCGSQKVSSEELCHFFALTA